MFDLPLLVEVGVHLFCAQVLLLDGVLGVVSMKRRDNAVVNLNDFRGDLVQKIAVVRDDNDSALII